jgi:hypothetical protein
MVTVSTGNCVAFKKAISEFFDLSGARRYMLVTEGDDHDST